MSRYSFCIVLAVKMDGFRMIAPSVRHLFPNSSDLGRFSFGFVVTSSCAVIFYGGQYRLLSGSSFEGLLVSAEWKLLHCSVLLLFSVVASTLWIHMALERLVGRGWSTASSIFGCIHFVSPTILLVNQVLSVINASLYSTTPSNTVAEEVKSSKEQAKKQKSKE